MISSSSSIQINLIRIIFLVAVILCSMAVCYSTRETVYEVPVWIGTLIGVALALAVIYLEYRSRRLTLRGFSRGTFGLMIGIFCAWLLHKLPVAELLDSFITSPVLAEILLLSYGLVLYLAFGFLGVILALRSGQEDFAFVIPYIRFRQTNVSAQTLLLDQSVILDGRLQALLDAQALEGRLVVPQFVLDAISHLAHTPDAVQRDRGQRALRLLNDLRNNPEAQLRVSSGDESSAAQPLEARLISSAQASNAKLVTTDETLTQAARLQSLSVLNIDEVAAALQPSIVVGEQLRLHLTRPGKEAHQAVGYLSNGTMIVVNQGAPHLGSTQEVVIVSQLQSSSGLLVFADLV